MKRWRVLYGGAAVFLGAAFFILMRAPLRESTLELDLWWMFGAISSLVAGKSGWEMVRFVLGPEPMALEPPVLKSFLLLTSPPIGLGIRHLALIAILVHGANALLLRRVLLQLRLGWRAAFFAACFYFTLLAHFHAFFWLPAFQHLFSVFTVLGLLHFYLKTEERIRANHPGWKRAYGATWVTALGASLQRTALVGWVLILADLIVGSRNREEWVARYRRWFPLFAVSLFYPAWILSSGADAALAGMVLHSGLPDRLRDFFLPAGATYTPVQSALKYPVFFVLGLAALLGLGGFLRFFFRWKNRWKFPLLWISCLLLGGFVLGAFQDKRQFLFPYHAITPFLSALASFLWPVETALKMGVPEPAYFYMPAQISLLGILASVLFIVFFMLGFVSRKRRLLLFFVWYLFCLVFILKRQDAGFPVVLPSRYFIHLSPSIGAVFCAVAVWGYRGLARALRMKPWTRELILVSFFTILCVSNLVAIRLALWRGKLANTYYAYDDLRIAHGVAEDLRKGQPSQPPWTVVLEGAEPLLSPRQIGGMGPVYVDRERYDNLRILLREETGPGRIARLLVNKSRFQNPVSSREGRGSWPSRGGATKAYPDGRYVEERQRRHGPALGLRSRNKGFETGSKPRAPPSSRRYVVRKSQLLDDRGRRLDPFGKRMQEGFSEMALGRPERAIRFLEEAAREKPFLLNYCLTSALRLEDLRWLTGGTGFRAWMRKVEAGWRADTRKFESVRSTMEEELSDYAVCLLTLSSLEAQLGNEGKSRYWLSQISFLEWDGEVLREWLEKQPLVLAHPALRQHLTRLKDPEHFFDPLPWRKDDYGFGRFLLRFLFGLDLRSAWDNRFNVF